MGKSKTGPRRLASIERQRHALVLRKAGVSYERIARELGYASASGAHNAVRRTLRRTVEEPARELRLLELARLDEAQAGLSPKVRAGDHRAVQALLAVMNHRARLTGLYEPERVDITQYLREVALAEGLDPDEVETEGRRIVEKYRL